MDDDRYTFAAAPDFISLARRPRGESITQSSVLMNLSGWVGGGDKLALSPSSLTVDETL